MRRLGETTLTRAQAARALLTAQMEARKLGQVVYVRERAGRVVLSLGDTGDYILKVWPGGRSEWGVLPPKE